MLCDDVYGITYKRNLTTMRGETNCVTYFSNYHNLGSITWSVVPKCFQMNKKDKIIINFNRRYSS